MLALACLVAATGCTSDLPGTIVLPATQENPDRDPPAAAVKVNVFNDSNYAASVQVDCYIGSTLVHHSEAMLEPVSSGELNNRLLLGLDEADRVVITARINDTTGAALWSDQKTFRMTEDFVDLDTVSYSIVYPPGSNMPPVASVQAPAAMTSGRQTTLDGTYSHDPAGATLTYAWQQISGPTVTLTNASAATPSFTAPPVSISTDVVFRLTVSNGQSSASKDVTVTIQPNRAPVAVIKALGNQPSGSTVALDGSGSYDPDNDPITYQWRQIGATPETTVTLSNTSSPVATFTAPAVSSTGTTGTVITFAGTGGPTGTTASSTLTFELTVTDQSLSSSQQVAVVIVAPPNYPPIVSVVPIPVVRMTDTVQLDGSGSFDLEKDSLTYQWQQVGATTGTAVSLSNADTPIATFIVPDTMPAKQTLTFQLTVSDSINPPVSTTIDIIVGPIAVPMTSSTSVTAGDTVTLDGLGSSIAGDSPTFTWIQLEGGPTVSLLPDAQQLVVTFTAPSVSTPTMLTFELTVDDGVRTDTASVGVYVMPPPPVNNPPVASVLLVSVVRVGDTVLLDGSYSYDLDGDPLTYQWTQLNSPPGPAVTLVNANQPTATFTVPNTVLWSQTLSFQLTVSDGHNPPVSANVDVTVGPLAVPVAPTSAMADSTVTLDGTGSIGRGLTYQWTQTSGPPVFLSFNTDHSIATFTAPSTGGLMTFDLTVSDSVLTHTASISVYGMSLGYTAPKAVIVAPTTVGGGQTVTLDGQYSHPSFGLTYTWTQTSGQTVTLSPDVNQPTVTFTAPMVSSVPETLTFSLKVNDVVNADTVTWSVTVMPTGTSPAIPIAVATSLAVVGDTVTLYGSASFDPTGGSLTYQWQQMDSPPAPAVTLSTTYLEDVTFTVPDTVTVEQTLTFQLTVFDTMSGFQSCYVDILVEPAGYTGNRPPLLTVSASALLVSPGQPVTLTATATDPDGDTVTCHWVPIMGFAGLPTPPSGPSPLNYVFNAPMGPFGPDNKMRFMAIADDGKGEVSLQPIYVKVGSALLLGDVNGDGIVNGGDIVIVQAAMGTTPGDMLWDPRADLNGNGVIDPGDLSIVIANQGHHL